MVYDPHPLKVGDRVEVNKDLGRPYWGRVLEVHTNLDVAWSHLVDGGPAGTRWVNDLNTRPLSLLERIADAARESA